ncbi:amidohydrolase [Saccharomonospora iraqiensis]|uniref:amidohydrolase n=1 Tax=Saccharomonospora iraqiensis TaxID=52698 RepID=UPI0003FB7363|nr:amidohydrolase [Saccharomonospora iraqiensis]
MSTVPRTTSSPSPTVQPDKAADLAARALHAGATGRWVDFFRDLHAHPELSMQEHRTARRVSEAFRAAGLEVTEEVGTTGVVGVLRNGDGPVVMLRGDMDALPIREETELPYRSGATGTLPSGRTVPVMHACGHDMHVTCVAATAEALSRSRDAWAGTLLVVAQPGEETFQGAAAMLADGLFTRFPKPDVALGQHVMPAPVGHVVHRSGTIMSATASIEVTIRGRGGHGSQPASCVDPVTAASYFVTRVQSVVSRETPSFDPVIITPGMFHAGSQANVIPDDAVVTLNLRAMSDASLERALTAVRRIAEAESAAAGSPRSPEFAVFAEGPATVNDERLVEDLATAHGTVPGTVVTRLPQPLMGSEDFSEYGLPGGRYDGEPVPYAYWLWGGVDPDRYPGFTPADAQSADSPVPGNHTSRFELDAEPTLLAGNRLLTTAALLHLA